MNTIESTHQAVADIQQMPEIHKKLDAVSNSIQKTDQDTRQKTEHIQYIDVLRVISMLSVVFLHTAAGVLRTNLASANWHFSNILTSIMSTSVPIFFMISGAMLLSNSKTSSLKITFNKRLPKALVPFVVWSVIAVIYFFLCTYIFKGSFDYAETTDRIKKLLSTPATIHLWFMYALIPLYLLSPLLKKLVDVLSKDLAIYMIGLWVVFSSLLPTFQSLVPARYSTLFTLNVNYNLNFFSGYLGYFIIGYYLLKLQKKISKRVLAIVIAVDMTIICTGTWYKTIASGQYNETFKSYSRIFTLVLSIAVFLLVKELLREKQLGKRMFSIVSYLSAISFGVYLVHNLIIDFMGRVGVFDASSMPKLVLMFLIALITSILCITVLTSIKPFSYIFTGVSYSSACKTCNIKFLFRKRTNGIKSI